MRLFQINYESILKSSFWAKARLFQNNDPHAKAWGKCSNIKYMQDSNCPIIYDGGYISSQRFGVLTPFRSGHNYSLVFLFISILLLISCSEKTISEDNLQYRNGVCYEVNETKPFNGTAVGKYSNGQIAEENKYKNGELISTAEWYSNDQKKREGNYKDGERHGRFAQWYENGQKEREVNYKDGKPHGWSTDWYENGQKWSEKKYKDGEQVSIVEWDKNGNILEQ